MNIDKDSVPGCWLYIGKDGSPIDRVRAGRNGGASTARIVWEANVGALDDDDLLRAVCDTPLCVNPEHRRVRNGVRTAASVSELRDAGRTAAQIAEHMDLSLRYVERVLIQLGKNPMKDAHRWTPEKRSRATLLLKEGVPIVWVAEDVQVSRSMITELRHRLGITDKDWVRTQLSVRKTKALAPLHELFQPRGVPA